MTAEECWKSIWINPKYSPKGNLNVPGPIHKIEEYGQERYRNGVRRMRDAALAKKMGNDYVTVFDIEREAEKLLAEAGKKVTLNVPPT